MLTCILWYTTMSTKPFKVDKGSSVVESLTRDQGVAGSSLTGITLLCP